MNRENQQHSGGGRRAVAQYQREAEDRLPRSTNFPPMQTSSFAAMFDVAQNHRHRNDSSSFLQHHDDEDPAFAYNEHQRGSKPQRERCFSHDVDMMDDDFASYGDGSFLHDQEGLFVQRNDDQDDELLDFDDLKDLFSGLKPEKKSGTSASPNVATELNSGVSHHHFVVIDTVNGGHANIEQQNVESQAAVVHNNTEQEDDDIFANERDGSDCGTSQQPDYALESTFQSLLDDDENRAAEENDITQNGGDFFANDNFLQCSMDNMSLLLDTLLPTTKSHQQLQKQPSGIDRPEALTVRNEVDEQQASLLHPIANIAAQEQLACPPESNRNEENNTSTIFINTCVDGTLSHPGLYQEAPPMHDGGQVVDQDDAVFWAGPNQQSVTTINLQRELSINVALAKKMQQSHHEASCGAEQKGAIAGTSSTADFLTASSPDFAQKPSKGGIIPKLNKVLSQKKNIATRSGKDKKITKTPHQVQKSKKPIKKLDDKFEKKEKLLKAKKKENKPTSAKSDQKKTTKKAKIIEFDPNQHGIEERKNAAGRYDKNSKRPRKGDRDYYQNFDFFFKRTCFRTMALYYKLAYKPFFDKWKAQQKRQQRGLSVLESLVHFANESFPGLLDTLGEKARFEFIELLKLLVLSHRHNKNDDFLADPLVDFSIVREPMYKYSKQAQDRFFSLSTYTFLFAWFTEAPEGRNFAVEKFAENEDARHPERMMAEVRQLGIEATRILKDASDQSALVMTRKRFQSQAESTQMAIKLGAYFERAQVKWQ